MSPEGQSWTEDKIFDEEWGESDCSVIRVVFSREQSEWSSPVWHRKQRPRGTRSSANAVFSEILHNSSLPLLLFWRTTLKVSQADPFNLTSLWSRSRNLDCLATSRGMEAVVVVVGAGGVDIGMVMRRSFQKNEWINKQSSVWVEQFKGRHDPLSRLRHRGSHDLFRSRRDAGKHCCFC